ncbi:type I secretion system permease/ATPase [Sulfurimonas paralvinellae]|uniref:Type I secretion system permease/ATPase n=1 Tax=Sulfurimonas paralvinellae TaxID=317658 RepID=A0A7M1B8N7_9BACT|nr:type I secretion system permease/ATPase [Sulfurimonas paralvinellae]QOP45168.1 type I secretion system permease/ATPase [Sulfurimonas paralvinellae]
MNEHKISVHEDVLLDTFVLFTKLFHKPFTKEALLAGLPIHDSQKLFSKDSSKSLFSRVAARAGLKSTLIKRSIEDMLSLHLPAILLLSNDNACILEKFNDDKTQAKIIYPEGDGLEQWVSVHDLEKEYLGFAYILKKEFEYDKKSSRTLQRKQKHWFWSTLKLSVPIYRDVLIASFLINLFVLATPLFTMNVYDRVIPNNAEETLMVFTIGIVLVYVLDFFLKFTRSYLLELAGKKSDIIMSSIIFEKVLDLKMSQHPPSVGSFANNLKDFESVRSFLTTATMTAVIDLPFAIIFLAVIYYIGGVLVFVPLVTIFLILLYALLIRKPLRESIEASYEASAKKNGILIETLQNIETVKTMRMNGKKQWEWEESTGEIAEKNLKSRLLSASIPSVTNLFVQLNTVFVVVFGVYLIKEFELTMGGLIAIVILTSRTVAPIGQAAALISNYSDAKTAYDTLDEIISREVERPAGQEFVERPKFQGKIEFKDVSFNYPGTEVPALTNVSFVINPGEKVAIIGRIGSGKSTIAKLILKLYEPTSGTILIDDIDIAQIDPADLRRFISYVPQDVHLFKGTIKDNIVSSEQHPDVGDVIYAAQVSGVEDFVRMHPMGYDMPIGERGAGLSGGQRQSVGIARALMQESSIMVMDEPSNSMDQTTEKNLLDRLKVELKDQTVVIITQKLGLLDMVERVIVMHNSKVLLDDKKETVVKQLSGVSNG